MADDKTSAGKGYPRHAFKDITLILKGWEYEPGTINVRKIRGLDGTDKIQMRLDLGLLQMELKGRPDGVRPHGCESLLDYYEKRLHDHRRRNGTESGFRLSPSQCQSLREEAMMYYQRYLSLFVLGEYSGVVRDTQRNLRVLDFCGQYAAGEHDRVLMEQYRPYILMMQARALASIELKKHKPRAALRVVRRALRIIREFFERFGQESAYKRSSEVRLLRRFAHEIKSQLPVDPVHRLQKDLTAAVEAERYEEAARLRDEIERLQSGSSGGHP